MAILGTPFQIIDIPLSHVSSRPKNRIALRDFETRTQGGRRDLAGLSQRSRQIRVHLNFMRHALRCLIPWCGRDRRDAYKARAGTPLDTKMEKLICRRAS